MGSLHMDLCLREGVFDTPMIHNKRSKQTNIINPPCVPVNEVVLWVQLAKTHPYFRNHSKSGLVPVYNSKVKYQNLRKWKLLLTTTYLTLHVPER